MKKLTIFLLTHCPYCVSARRAVDALIAENPAYAGIDIEWIEESRQRAIAEQYDYYYVPSVFSGTEKLYEAHPGDTYDFILDKLRGIFDAAL